MKLVLEDPGGRKFKGNSNFHLEAGGTNPSRHYVLLWFQRFLRNVKISPGSVDMTNSNFGGIDFYIGNTGMIFGDFL